jgi:hypothetical protein
LRPAEASLGSSNTHFRPDENIFRLIATNGGSAALYQ